MIGITFLKISTKYDNEFDNNINNSINNKIIISSKPIL